jgi:hypothetical protein
MTKIASIGIDQAFGKTAVVINISKGGFRDIRHKLISSVPLNSPYEKFFRAKYIAAEIMAYIETIREEFKNEDLKWFVVIEGLSHGSAGKMASANRDLAGLQFIIMDRILEVISANNCLMVAPKQLKKFATDNGNATKDDMVLAIEKDYKKFYDLLMSLPKTTGRYDLADAFWLSEFAHETIKI